MTDFDSAVRGDNVHEADDAYGFTWLGGRRYLVFRVLEDSEWEENTAFDQEFHVRHKRFEPVEWAARHVLVQMRILNTAKIGVEVFGVRFGERDERYALDAGWWEAVAEH